MTDDQISLFIGLIRSGMSDNAAEGFIGALDWSVYPLDGFLLDLCPKHNSLSAGAWLALATITSPGSICGDEALHLDGDGRMVLAEVLRVVAEGHLEGRMPDLDLALCCANAETRANSETRRAALA